MEKKILKKIKRIEIQTAKLATDQLIGSYRSVFKGKGIEFEEVREYHPGDDVRYIDWNVTARMQHPYIKTFREEREITVMLIVDVSGSERFGVKSEWIAEIGGVLSFSVIKNNDRVGLILFSDRVEKYIPPRKGKRHVLQLIRELLLFKPQHKKTNIAKALTFFGNVQKQMGICFVISDFMDENYAHQMEVLSRKHDLIAIQMIDPFEEALPKTGFIQFQDLETGKVKLIDTSDPIINDELKKQAWNRALYLKRIVNKTGMGLIKLTTDKPYMPVLKKFFKMRERRQ